VNGKLDPASNQEWQAYYRIADQRRRLAGWHRRPESKPLRGKLDSGKLLAVVMGLATITVILCLAFPT